MSFLHVGIFHLIHYIGFAMALGGAIAAHLLIGLARQHSASLRAGLELAARKASVAIELPGLFLALFGGIYGIVLNPNHLKPALSGAGPWMHIKLTLVLVLLIVAHLRMFRLARLVRERESGASEADCDALARAAKTLGAVDLALYGAIFVVACLRFVIFA